MRQLLILGFYCDIYKKQPQCRVYVNDVLLDEFDIPQSDKVTNNQDLLDPLGRKVKFKVFTTNPPFLKYIEFDDADADSLDVVIKIQNDDNNYTNGFMSKYTHIILSHFYLASKKVLENIDKLELSDNLTKFLHKNWEKYKHNIVDCYTVNRTPLFKNFAGFIETNFTNIHLKSTKYSGGYSIGSSGHYRLTVKKKLGFWRTSKDRYIGYYKLGENEFVKYLYNKYKQYEDQRNSNT